MRPDELSEQLRRRAVGLLRHPARWSSPRKRDPVTANYTRCINQASRPRTWVVSFGSSGGADVVAYQGGSRRLADEVLRAWTVWEERGAPVLYDFGLTRTEHEQWVWSGDPDGPRWQPLETAAVH